MVDNQRSGGAMIAGSDRADRKPDHGAEASMVTCGVPRWCPAVAPEAAYESDTRSGAGFSYILFCCLADNSWEPLGPAGSPEGMHDTHGTPSSSSFPITWRG